VEEYKFASKQACSLVNQPAEMYINTDNGVLICIRANIMMVNLREVKPGMVLQRDLVHDGRTLLKAESKITEAMISVLNLRGVTHLDVVNDADHAAPGADLYYKMAIDPAADQEYQRKKEAINRIFTTAEDDEQMHILKYCMIRQLEEEYSDKG